jgi:hypothetical protein
MEETEMKKQRNKHENKKCGEGGTKAKRKTERNSL